MRLQESTDLYSVQFFTTQRAAQSLTRKMRAQQRLTIILRTAGLRFVSTDGLLGSELFEYAGPITHEVRCSPMGGRIPPQVIARTNESPFAFMHGRPLSPTLFCMLPLPFGNVQLEKLTVARELSAACLVKFL